MFQFYGVSNFLRGEVMEVFLKMGCLGGDMGFLYVSVEKRLGGML